MLPPLPWLAAGEEFDRLSGLRQLSRLCLRGCYALGDAGVGALGVLRLPALRALDLQECWQITVAGLAHLSGECQEGGGRCATSGSRRPGLASRRGQPSLWLSAARGAGSPHPPFISPHPT